MSAKKVVHFASVPSTCATGFSPIPIPSGGLHGGYPMDIGSSAAGNALFHTKQSPPFRTGGRGSKQLSKAIEHSAAEKTSSGLPQDSDPVWVMHTKNPVYFAKYVSTNCQDPGSVLVQKMQPSHVDQALLVPWDGHLCIVKNEYLQRIEMRKEPAGWRILETPMMSKIIADLREQAGCSPVPALMPIGGSKRKYDDWDYVSLESSDFDEASSKASSSLFKMLSSGAPDAPSSGTAGCVPVRQKMDISVAAAVATVTAGKQLTISPAEDKIAVAVPSCGLSYGKPTELCAPVRFVLPLSSSRAPGILKFVGDRPSLGRSESPEPHAMLTVPSTIDSTDSHASSKRPPARSSSSLYRTPSPQNIGRVVVTEPWLQDFDCDTLSSVPRLEELSNAAAARHSSIHEESFLDDDGNDTDTTVEATDIGMGVEDNSDKLDEVAKVTQLTEAESSTNTEVSEPHAEVNAEAIVCVDISGTPTCDKTDAFPATKLPKEVKKKIRREGDREVALDPQPMRRRAAAQSGNYAQRNSFLGSWPSRKQSAAAGTWNL